MAVNSRRDILKILKQRKYLNRDFDGFRADLLEYARTHFPNNIKDFSESSLGGLLLEFAAYVGDVDSFYLDHQFHEVNIETAVEDKNIQAHLKRAGVAIVGASPAVVDQTFYIEVPATGNPPEPNTAALPVVHAGTVLPAENGVQFELTEDIDFREIDETGALLADITISQRDSNSTPTSFILTRVGECVSGFRASENFSVGSFRAFQTFALSKENVTEIISVKDAEGNIYYEVDYLTQDTVFRAITNRDEDYNLVPDNLIVTPAPFRFIKEMSLDTRLTTLTFGGGSAESLDDDIIPDPSQFAIPLYGKRTFSRFTLNPGNLLQTTTLGIITPNTTITVDYRYGGGLSHNVGAKTIRGTTTLIMSFPNEPTPTVAQFVRSSFDSLNMESAAGGEDAPTTDELKLRVPAARSAQSRIVTKEDLIARVYTMPSNFGRVFRAATRPNPLNPLATSLYIISRNSDNQLVTSPDSLKKNLSTYLNQFRLSNDAIDILDAMVINIQIDFAIVVDPAQNKNLIKQNVISQLKKYFSIKNFEIDQPIYINDIENILYNNDGVYTVHELRITNINGTVGDGANGSDIRIYSDVVYDVEANTDKKIIFTPPGAIFEIRFPSYDIRCQVSG